MENFDVRIVKGTTIRGEADWNNQDLKSSDPVIKLMAATSTIKVDLTKLLQPVLSGTNMDTYSVCDNIVRNLNIDELILSRIKKSILRAMVFNEVYRICIQASAITGKDYAEYLNSQYIIDDIAEKLIILFNK